MNYSLHLPRQSFPTDVTDPGPSQLPSQPEPSSTRIVQPEKPPLIEPADEQDEDEDNIAA